MTTLRKTIFLFSLLCISKLLNAQSTAATNVYNAANFLGWGTTSGDLPFKVNNTTWMTLKNTTGFLGIGTTNPLSMLHVSGGSVLFQYMGNGGTTPMGGGGIRMMWIPAKAAFRAGGVDQAWNDANIGMYSFAACFNSQASGQGACAVGSQTIASGVNSFVANASTNASGSMATSFGQNTTAQSYNSFVLGRYNYNPGTYNTTTWVATDPLFVIGNGTSAGATSNAMTILKNGNTGIGVTAPIAPLHVATSLSTGEGLILDGTIVDPTYGGKWAMGDGLFISDGIFSISDAKGSGNPIPRLIINSTGNVGIGTTNPGTYKLAVEGVLGARALKITLASWADFVFNDDYKLKSLSEVENFIKKHKHLPEVPTAVEIEKNGLDVAEIQAKQMQKIEELTLYLIELNKKVEKLEQENDVLKKK